MNPHLETGSPFRGPIIFQLPPTIVSSCSHPSFPRLPLIIIFCRFGGRGDGEHFFNDTWSFNISTRKWTELQCTGSIPSPRSAHAAVLVDNVMYVFGGRDTDGTRFGDLTALDLSSE